MIHRFKDRLIDLLFDMSYCLCLIDTTGTPLTVNITVQRLNINVVLDILI